MDQNLFFIDFETTGLNPYHNEPIEIAIQKYNNKNYYQTLIIPSINGVHYKYISPKINQITGITDHDIEKKAIQKNEALINLCKYIHENYTGEGDIYIIAHNGLTFDFLFLKKMIKEYYHSNHRKTRNNLLYLDIIQKFKYIDTILLAKLLIPDSKVNQPSLCKRFNIYNNSEHRSLGDVNALIQLYTTICEQLSYIHNHEKDFYLKNPSTIIKELFI